MRVAPKVLLTDAQERELIQLARSEDANVRLALRAQIVLLASQGLQNKDIAKQLGIGRAQVARWRERYLVGGLQGIERDLPRGAPPVKVDVARLMELTTQTTPETAAQWSTRKMGQVLGVSASTVMRHWHAQGLEPHLLRGFKVSQDPDFVEKLEDIAGLYMSSPVHALVLCCKEKKRLQVPDFTRCEMPRRTPSTYEYNRKSIARLVAALKVLDGRRAGQHRARHTHVEWLNFLRQVDRETPKGKTLHLIVDAVAVHRHPAIVQWLGTHSRFHMRFTPVSAPWLSIVEQFFRDIATARPRRGVLASVSGLVVVIDDCIARRNSTSKPFMWLRRARHPGNNHAHQQSLQAAWNTKLGLPEYVRLANRHLWPACRIHKESL